jgi:multisubunit Na+/H+ antiporter MnhC subunit
MRALVITAIIASLAVPAFAAEDPSKAEQYKVEEQKRKEAEEIEKAYAAGGLLIPLARAALGRA